MKILNSLKLIALVLIGASVAYGQASRTWVSGVGDDANPCSRTAPCKTFAGAISKTAPGGEIDALDPGGFGALTITKSITIDGGGGQVASVLVAGTNGIVVTDGGAGTANVILRNLRINGLKDSGNGGINGINFLSGHDLNVENCVIFGFNNTGINIALNQPQQGTVHIINTIIKNVGGDGIRATNAQAPAVHVGITRSAIALAAVNGVEAAQHSHVVVNDSFIEHGGSSGLSAGDAATSDAVLTIDHSDISFNGNGVSAQAGGTVSVADSKFAFNASCGYNSTANNVFVYTQGGQPTNRAQGNGTNTCGTTQTIATF
jgi:hypothetical protein